MESGGGRVIANESQERVPQRRGRSALVCAFRWQTIMQHMNAGKGKVEKEGSERMRAKSKCHSVSGRNASVMTGDDHEGR